MISVKCFVLVMNFTKYLSNRRDSKDMNLFLIGVDLFFNPPSKS